MHAMCLSQLHTPALHGPQVQSRSSLHAHIILWVDKRDVPLVRRKLCSVVPAHTVPGHLRPGAPALSAQTASGHAPSEAPTDTAHVPTSPAVDNTHTSAATTSRSQVVHQARH